jgi:hypothetical protein
MSFIDFIKKNLIDFFIIVTCVNLAIAILGANFDSNASLGYEAYFSPIIFGAIATFPSIILFSPRELTFKQMLVRRVMHFITLEILLIGFAYSSRIIQGTNMVISFSVTVFLVYLVTNIIRWIIDSNTANKINQGLKKLQG